MSERDEARGSGRHGSAAGARFTFGGRRLRSLWQRVLRTLGQLARQAGSMLINCLGPSSERQSIEKSERQSMEKGERVSPDAIAALGVLMAGYARLNARRTPEHAATLGRAVLGALGMGSAYADSQATTGVMRLALDQALGRGWQTRVEQPIWSEDRKFLRRSGVFEVTRSRRRFAQVVDQHYGDDKNQVLDLWRHPDLPADARAPVVLQIPGGAWVLGGKRGQGYPLMSHLAARGWLCASMSYRLAPRNPWPAHIIDVKRAIAWLRQNAHEYGGDPDFIVLTGGSAGGHLAALAALSPNDPAFQPGFEEIDTSVQAAVPLYGRYDWFTHTGEGRPEFMHFLQQVVVQQSVRDNPRVFQEASPILRVNSEAPPFLIVHGNADSIIPVSQARDFFQALSDVSSECVAYAELPGAHHGFDLFNSRRTAEVSESVTEFLGVVLGQHRTARHDTRLPRPTRQT